MQGCVLSDLVPSNPADVPRRAALASVRDRLPDKLLVTLLVTTVATEKVGRHLWENKPIQLAMARTGCITRCRPRTINALRSKNTELLLRYRSQHQMAKSRCV